MGPRSWEHSVKLPVTQLQLFLHNKDLFLRTLILSWQILSNLDDFIIKIAFYGTQVLRTQYIAANDSRTIILA
jgi:hypothetical protein